MKVIGDIHGKIEQYLEKIYGVKESFQVGDMGIGFDNLGNHAFPTKLSNHKFIRGNHDDPALCQSLANYAGEFGYIKDKKLFFCGGADSIDKQFRIAYERRWGKKIWWPDEELSEEQLMLALALYIKKKPEIVITHDCPDSVRTKLLRELVPDFRPEKDVACRTSKAFEAMFLRHQPKIWIFGHYHVDQDFELAGTRFICLNELSVIDIPTGE